MKYIHIVICVFLVLTGCAGKTTVDQTQTKEVFSEVVEQEPNKIEKLLPQLEVDFAVPNIEKSSIQHTITAWGNQIIDVAKMEYKQADPVIQSPSPLLKFTYEKHEYNGVTSIVYFVEKSLYKAPSEHITYSFYTEKNGNEIFLSDMIDMENKKTTLLLLLKRELEKKDEVFVNDLHNNLEKYLENAHVFFDEDKVFFIFDKTSHIAPYSLGNIEISFPIEKVRGLLLEKYFPKNMLTEAEKKKIHKKIADLQREKSKKQEVSLEGTAVNKQMKKVVPKAQPQKKYHIVQEGEYVKLIADLYSVDYTDIIRLNNLTKPDKIEVGQKLLISKGDMTEDGYDLDTSDVSEKTNTQDNLVTQDVAPEKKYIALTFDDGPRPKTTHQLLHILKKRNVKATFFVLGKNTEMYPDTVLWAHNDGHEIGNHTWTHPNLTTISKEKVREEMRKTDEAIKKVIGENPTIMRPPYGAFDDDVKAIISDKTVVMWDADSRDWRNRNVRKNLNTVLPEVHSGSIILFHDIHQPSVDTIDALITNLQSKGYIFVTVSELLEKGQDDSYIGKICYSQFKCK